MANVNTRVPLHRQTASQAPVHQEGWVRKAFRAVKEAVSGTPTTGRSVQRGPDRFEAGARVDINRPRQLNALNSGRSRGKPITVPDSQILGFLDTMSRMD